MLNTYEEVLDAVQTAFRQFAICSGSGLEDAATKALNTVNRADAFGAILDPTMYRAALSDRRLERQRRLLELFLHTKRELAALFPEDAAALRTTEG